MRIGGTGGFGNHRRGGNGRSQCRRNHFSLQPQIPAEAAHTTRAGAIIAGPDVDTLGKPVLRSADPYMSFARALEIFYPPQRPPAGIHPTAVIAPDAKLGRNPSIGPYVVIEAGAEIGDDCVLKSFVMIYPGVKIGDRFFAHSHAVVRENVRIGNDVILQNGVVIGGDGFGFVPRPDGTFYKIVQAGTVVIEDGVEVQSNSCIDRAAVGETRLRRGVKVDNLVQVAHGCDIGENSLLCSQVGIAGSTTARTQCDPDRTGRRGWALDHRRPRDRDPPNRRAQRRPAPHHNFRIPRRRPRGVAESLGSLSAPAGNVLPLYRKIKGLLEKEKS